MALELSTPLEIRGEGLQSCAPCHTIGRDGGGKPEEELKTQGSWCRRYRASLLRLIPQVCDQVVPVLRLLQSAECHLRAGDVLLGVLEVFKLLLALA